MLFVFLTHLFNKLLTERTSGSKVLLLQRHVLFGLRVKGGIFNQAVYKQPNVVLDLEMKQLTLSGAFFQKRLLLQ